MVCEEVQPLVEGSYLGPLRDGATVAIIGGGPGGCSVALTLLRFGKELGRRFRVYMYEPKHFGVHYNQCLGILSPPLLDILKDEFGLSLPTDLVLRKISGYILHSGEDSILLMEDEDDTLAVRRVELDAFLLEAVRRAGVEVIRSRVTALESQLDGITVFSEGEYLKADVVFGCFGLDPGMAFEIRRRSFYRPPRRLETLVTKYECDRKLMERIGNKILAFLPPISGVEFAAITPKAAHASVVLAGRRVQIEMLEQFLEMPEVKPFLPERMRLDRVYKGAFPCRPARGFYDDRFVTVGDAAGLIRPFKGKGINSAMITGALAARTAATVGVSRRAFREYGKRCRFITRDYPYGRFVRVVTYFITHRLSLGPVMRFAKRNPSFRWALAKSVSGGATYRDILRRCLRPKVILGLLWEFLTWPFRSRGKRLER